MAIDVLKQRTLMNVNDARSLFIQELHSYLVAHFSNTPKLAITMDCTGRIADIVLYIHCTNDQWNIVAIDVLDFSEHVESREDYVVESLSMEEQLHYNHIKYFSVDEITLSYFNSFIQLIIPSIVV